MATNTKIRKLKNISDIARYGKIIKRILNGLVWLARNGDQKTVEHVLTGIDEIVHMSTGRSIQINDSRSETGTSPTVHPANQTPVETEGDNATRDPIMSKNTYIAIVGDSALKNQDCIALAREQGFTSNNVKVYSDFKQFKNGRYTDSLKSPACRGIIFGGIPHSHKGNIENEYAEKVVYAEAQSGSHGVLKITKTSLKAALKVMRKKIINQNEQIKVQSG